MRFKPTLAVLAAAALVAFPAGATAKNGNGGGKSGKGADAADTAKPGKSKKPKKPKVSTYEFKALVVSVSPAGVQVEVTGGNSRARKLTGQTLTFDVSKAKLKVRDTNDDGERDLADVLPGDRVKIQAKLPRGAVAAGQALPARHFVDKGPAPAPKPEDGESKDDDSKDDDPKTEDPKDDDPKTETPAPVA